MKNNGNGNLELGEISTIRNILMGDEMSNVNHSIKNIESKLESMESNFSKKLTTIEKKYEERLNKMKDAYESKIKALEEELTVKSTAIEEKIIAVKNDDRKLLSDLFAQVSEQLKNG